MRAFCLCLCTFHRFISTWRGSCLLCRNSFSHLHFLSFAELPAYFDKEYLYFRIIVFASFVKVIAVLGLFSSACVVSVNVLYTYYIPSGVLSVLMQCTWPNNVMYMLRTNKVFLTPTFHIHAHVLHLALLHTENSVLCVHVHDLSLDVLTSVYGDSY